MPAERERRADPVDHATAIITAYLMSFRAGERRGKQAPEVAAEIVGKFRREGLLGAGLSPEETETLIAWGEFRFWKVGPGVWTEHERALLVRLRGAREGRVTEAAVGEINFPDGLRSLSGRQGETR